MVNWIVGALVHLRRIVTAPQDIDGLRKDVDAMKEEIAFLKVFQQAYAATIHVVHQLQALHENQKIKLNNLSRTVENDIVPMLQLLEQHAPAESSRSEVVNLRKRARLNVSRAKTRLSA